MRIDPTFGVTGGATGSSGVTTVGGLTGVTTGAIGSGVGVSCAGGRGWATFVGGLAGGVGGVGVALPARNTPDASPDI